MEEEPHFDDLVFCEATDAESTPGATQETTESTYAPVPPLAECIAFIMRYFNVSELCAQYMYHRAYRSKMYGANYLPWDTLLQNAIVRADRHPNFDWNAMQFGEERDYLIGEGFSFGDVPSKTFRWDDEPRRTTHAGWSLVIDKRKIKAHRQKQNKLRKKLSKNYVFTHRGLLW